MVTSSTGQVNRDFACFNIIKYLRCMMLIYWYLTHYVCMPIHFKKCMFFFFPPISRKFLVFTGRKCFNKGKYKYFNNAGSIFFCLND